MHNDCEICRRIDLIKSNKNPYFVREMQTGYVVIGDNQYFKGYTLFLCKIHVNELHQLPSSFKKDYLMEMSLVSEATCKAFNADKMNIELLGNVDSHVHWHIFPRHINDTKVKGPVWWGDKDIMFNQKYLCKKEELIYMKIKLNNELSKLLDI